jgi:hypothetical protein
MSSFTSSFTTSIAKQPTLCPTLWSASLKTHSHRVKHMVKLQKHGSLPRSWSCSCSCFLKKQLYRWSWAVPNGSVVYFRRFSSVGFSCFFCKNKNGSVESETRWVWLQGTHNHYHAWGKRHGFASLPPCAICFFLCKTHQVIFFLAVSYIYLKL